MGKIFITGVIVAFVATATPIMNTINYIDSMLKTEFQINSGNILYVGGVGPNNYTRIQDAIDDATNGDIIFVYRGTYHENIVANKSITLIGEDKNVTFIDGDGLGDVLYISADNVVVSEFTIQNSGKKEDNAGIDVVSNCVTISWNIIANNGRNGISFNGSSDSTIFQNIISNNRYAGIFLCNSSNNTIVNNFIANHTRSPYYSRGIYLKLSDNNIILNNTFTNNAGYDIFLIESPYTTVIDNNCMNASGVFIAGSDLSHWNTHIIENNYVDGKPLYYYKDIDETTIVPLDTGEVILANCSRFIIQNLNIVDGDVGILLGFSSHNEILYNNIANVIAGIWLTHSSYNTISDNTISNVGGGIPMIASSNHNTISENIIADNWEYGIGLWSSSYNTISRNTIKNNQQAGIYLMIFSTLNTISKNAIMDNWYGVYLSSSFISIIKNNNFIENRKHAFFENSIANFWLRNYWDDHTKFGPKAIDGKITLPWNPSKTIDWKNFDWLPVHEPYKW